MSELKLGFVVNTKYAKEGTLAHRIHLLIVRILLYYCYTHKNIQWGYHLFRSGRVNISYKKISLQKIALKPAQKLLSDLLHSVSDPRGNNTKPSKVHRNNHVTHGGKEHHLNGGANGSDVPSELEDEAKRENCLVTRSWEEVLSMVASDWDDHDESENILFVLSSALLGDSDRIRSILANLKKEKKVNLVMIDIGALEGSSLSLDRVALNQMIQGKYTNPDTCLIPTELLCSDLSHFWFRQIFKSHLTKRARTPSKQVKFIGTETIVILDDSTEDIIVDDSSDMVFHLHPLDDEASSSDPVEIISLKFMMEVSYSTTWRYLDHKNCYLVLFDEKFCSEFTTPDHPSFVVEAVEVSVDRKRTSSYVIKHLTPTIGVMFSLLEQCIPSDLVRVQRVAEEEEVEFDLLSFHDLTVDEEQSSFREVVRQLLIFMRDNTNRSEIDDSNLLEQIKSFHDLHINDTVHAPLLPTARLECSDTKESCEVENTFDTLPALGAECAADEAMLQASPRYYQRSNIAALVRKYQNDVKQELLSPGKLKEKHCQDRDNLVKEHKMQVVLHLVWYSEFSDMEPEDKEEAKAGVLSLLRSLSFLTSPNEMFSFLTDQVVGEFHSDCQELLRELYEDGFLMEVPDILCDDSNSLSLSSSILSVHAAAPLYCEDTSSQSNDLPTTSHSTSSRQRSWMDPQLSQSSFSITIPKYKKKKKKKEREIGGKVGEDRNRIAAKVCSKKQSGVERSRVSYLSSEITPDEAKQSSKRRKLSRKNSVLDTPLKKQVKNPTAAKTSRSRQRVEVTPQKCSPVSQIQESPVRASLSRASSFFGSQAQPPAMRSFVIKDGFKTPTRPAIRTTPSSSTEDIPSLFRSPDQGSQHFTPPPDSNSQCSGSQHSFTPPGTPRAGRKFVKKLSYNSPMRALFFTGSSNVIPSPKRTPLDSDYIQMKASPSCSLLDKENEPFFPSASLKYFGDPSERKLPKISDALANTLEPIFNPRLNEDTQMPPFESSPYQGTINLQSKGGFLKLLEESSSASFGIQDKRRDSDNESDVSAASSMSGYRSILKSPFTKGRRIKKRTVSFSLDAAEVQFSSDNESESAAGNFFSLLNLVDGSIRNDEVTDVTEMFGCESLTEQRAGTSLQTDNQSLDNNPLINGESENALLEESRKRKREESHEK